MGLVEVEFDCEAELRPVGIELVTVRVEVHRGGGDAGAPNPFAEVLLEARAGEGQVGLVEGKRPPQPAAAEVPTGAVEHVLERTKVEEAEFFDPLEQTVQLLGLRADREVHQRSRHRRHRYPLPLRPVLRRQDRGEVDDELPLCPPPNRGSHVDPFRRIPIDPPKVGSGRMTGYRWPNHLVHLIRFRPQDSAQAPRVPRKPPMPHRIDPAMQNVKSPSMAFMHHKLLRITQRTQLLRRHDTVLASRKVRYCPNRRWRSSLVAHTENQGRTPPWFSPAARP